MSIVPTQQQLPHYMPPRDKISMQLLTYTLPPSRSSRMSIDPTPADAEIACEHVGLQNSCLFGVLHLPRRGSTSSKGLVFWRYPSIVSTLWNE